MLGLMTLQPSPLNHVVNGPTTSAQQIFRSWVDAPNNDNWSKLSSESKVTTSVFKPRILFEGSIVGDQRPTYQYGMELRPIPGEKSFDYNKRLREVSKEKLRRLKLGLPEYDNISQVNFMGFVRKLGPTMSRTILLYIDCTPKDDTTRVGSVLFHHGDSSRILQELDFLVDLARRWRGDGRNHDEREKSFTFEGADLDSCTVTISQRPGSDNLMWQVFGINNTEFTSMYTNNQKDAPIRKVLLDKSGKVVFNKDGSIRSIVNDGFSEFALFVNQLRTVIGKLDEVKKS
jgi:hypothetical protein